MSAGFSPRTVVRKPLKVPATWLGRAGPTRPVPDVLRRTQPPRGRWNFSQARRDALPSAQAVRATYRLPLASNTRDADTDPAQPGETQGFQCASPLSVAIDDGLGVAALPVVEPESRTVLRGLSYVDVLRALLCCL